MLLAGRLHAFVRGPGGALFQKAQRPADVAAEIEAEKDDAQAAEKLPGAAAE